MTVKVRDKYFALAIGFCILGLSEANDSLELLTIVGIFRYDESFTTHVGLWLPLLLAAGTAVLTWNRRSAIICIWVLALGWLCDGVRDLSSFLLSNDVTRISFATVQTLFSLACVGHFVFRIVAKHGDHSDRKREIAAPVVAIVLVFGPMITDLYYGMNENEFLEQMFRVRLVFCGWRVVYIYLFSFTCLLVYEWIRGRATARVKPARSNRSSEYVNSGNQ